MTLSHSFHGLLSGKHTGGKGGTGMADSGFCCQGSVARSGITEVAWHTVIQIRG